METIEILDTVRQMVADGKNQEAQDFLVAHFKELPEDIQGDLLIAFVKDAADPRKLQNMGADLADAAMRTIDRVNAAEEELLKTPEGEN